MESPASIVRRRAWINSSRQWPTLEELEGPLCNLPSASIADDDVFSDGCFTGKIENWLLGCGPNASSENTGQLSFESVLNLDDDLGLGADASVLNSGELSCAAGRPTPHPKQPHSSVSYTGLCLPSLSLGHSMASSCPSFSTCKTTSSVSEILQMCSEDAEETLYTLGFGCDEPQAHVRIPPRFFTFPSQAQGINFRLFLDSQIRRIREEDPGLSLASRFRQVQVLTAMANAFYSLYSHVSRTPLQKLATPEFTVLSPVERIERFRSSVRSEPRSPVERLKDTVSKMCLYTGSPRGSDSTSPQPSPRKRSSLSDVDVVVVKAKSGAPKKLDLEEHRQSMDVRVEQTQQTVVDTDILQHGTKVGHKETHASKNHSVETPLASSFSGDTVIEADHHFFSRQAERDSCLSEMKPVANAACDLICPQIVDDAHKAPFCCRHTRSQEERTDTSCPESHQHHVQAHISEPDEDSHTSDAASSAEARSRPILPHNDSHPHYCITVTGSEGNDLSPCSLSTPDSSHTSSVLPVRTRGDSFNKEKTWHLDPLTYQGLGQYSKNPQQVNSFELEEVHSAGEDDVGQSDTTRPMTALLSTKHQCKGEVVRGDSVQSDSSGYADEEFSLSLDRSGR